MAVFASELAFNIANLNFNLPFQGGFTLDGQPGGSLIDQPPPYPIGGQAYDLPGLNLTFHELLQVSWGSGLEVWLGGNDLVYAGDATISAGTVGFLFMVTNEALNYGFAGVSLAAADLSLAAHTASTTDDLAIVSQLLAGNDLVGLSEFNDVFNSGAGKDLIGGAGGADRINGAAGDDIIEGGKGNDRIDGGSGNDVVIGGTGDDRLKGGAGNDAIWAGTGSDTVAGGLGRDVFLFKSGDGSAVITDFNAAADQLLLIGPLAGLANLQFRQVGADLEVTFSDVVVILQNTLRADVTSADVAIGGNAALVTMADAFFAGWDFMA